MTVEFRLLGDLEVRIRGRVVNLGHARQRGVLAALLVDANRTVPVSVLLDRVWSDHLPQRARNALSGYVSRIRRLLSGTDEVSIARLPDGYRLTVDPAAVDLHRFHDLVSRARECLDGNEAVRLFEQALGLWHGDAFGCLEAPWLDGVRVSLNAQRLAAELDRNDQALRCGRHAMLQGELSASSAAHPQDERLAGQAMLALYRCGRQAEALHRYEKLRQNLAEELGADPSPPLQQLYKQILTADPALAPAGAGLSTNDTPVPRQLPAAPRAFTGRAAELAALDALLDNVSGDPPPAVVISAVSGTAGVGKTALAVHWGHRVAEAFADGQLYVNLRGFDPSGSVTAAEAVRGFLDALGVPPQRIPAGLDAQAALYRSLLAGKRMLIVLDNARDAEHARPLLPGMPGCLVMVTSRNELTGLLAAEGAHSITLDLMTGGEAHDLLAARLGAQRVQAEPDAAAQIITRCSRLPLPLTIMAARAVTRPDFPLSALADELGRTGTALDALDAADPRTNLRAVFWWSYRTLSEPAARLFRLLGTHPGPDISVSAAASLAALPVAQTRALLAELTHDHLLAEDTPGRFGFHDLLRAYAIEQNRLSESEPERTQAAHRLLYHYLHTARAAAMQASPTRDPITIGRPPPGVILEEPGAPDSAMDWFTREHHVLLGAIGLAERTGFSTYIWQLAWTMTTFLDRRGHWNDWVQTGLAAVAAARKLDDPVEQARAHRYTARAYTRLDRLADAHAHLEQALELYSESVDRVGLAEAHLRLGQVLDRQGHQAKALDHAIEALQLFRAAGWLAGEAAALNAVGWYQALLGDYRQALVSCGEALPRLQELGDRQGQADTWDSLGYVHHHLGRQRQAVTSYRNAISLYRELGDRYDEAVSLGYLGDAHNAAGERAAAVAAWRKALSVLDGLNHPEAEQVRRKLAGR
ncbi:MAG TPA: BTAD domain-containing putative transcriptional regulator [Candidatus Limnocylindrales bacterium]|nr:BTAD domain-containing putative transcriptional regulator [Candidatus Limnocylindrales bacterium]